MHQGGMAKESNYESHEVIEYRRKRRPRDDPMERNYICVCGKKYLSYPALYTHIKNKHQGKTPSPGDVIGMPRIGQTRSMMVTREQPENQHEKNISTPDEALVYVINTFKAYSQTKLLNYTQEELFKQFSDELKKEMEERTRQCLIEKIQLDKISDNGLKVVTMDNIFAKFISLLMNKIDKSILEEFIFILLIYRKCINTQYLKNADPTSITQSRDYAYTKEALGTKMLDNINEFVLYYYHFYSKPYHHWMQDKDMCFLSLPKKEFIGLTKFMFLFGRWAFLERYTNSKVKINNF